MEFANIPEVVREGCDIYGCIGLYDLINIEISHRITKSIAISQRVESNLTIKVSKLVFPTGNNEDQRDAVLHETAHIISFAYLYNEIILEGVHGDTWKRVAEKVGAKPIAFYNEDEGSFDVESTRYYYLPCRCGRRMRINVEKLLKLTDAKMNFYCKNCQLNITKKIAEAKEILNERN